MRAWYRVDAAGTAVDLTEAAGRQLLKEWGLNATDMRVLATHRRMQNTSLTLTETYLCIRHGAVAIAATDSCSLLSDCGHESSGVVHEVCRRLRSYRNFMNLEGDVPTMSVQHVVADTVLDLCMIDFSTKQVALENEIDFHLMQLEKKSTEVDLFQLRSCKTRLYHLSTSIDSLHGVLAGLQTDSCAEATGSMLVAYHDHADDLVQHLRILGDRISDTEALAGLRSDQQRNQILRFELARGSVGSRYLCYQRRLWDSRTEPLKRKPCQRSIQLRCGHVIHVCSRSSGCSWRSLVLQSHRDLLIV